MKISKKIILGLVVVILLIPIWIFSKMSSTYLADYPHYSDEDTLIKEADVIVIGKVDEISKAKINVNQNQKDQDYDKSVDDLLEYTVSEVQVLDVLKGDIRVGEKIQIKQLGHIDGIIKIKNYFNKNKEYFFFLKKYDDITPGMPYSTLNPIQGHIEIDKNKIIIDKENQLFKDMLNKDDLSQSIKKKVKD
ncbi:hypothetical protein [Alkaliphilus serpentinus]|uniref:Uncharacterized protein n=1 Tax=Alkaliphilus serpentinus TaxID=1482731 RepID=A0A833MAQ1_9FIRM|nr:hypothetical protein [Alkaliphilus serpentinus]KAB3533084.1 hypothetical protein F8153_00610 [Alkaliphilus serpentinus]